MIKYSKFTDNIGSGNFTKKPTNSTHSIQHINTFFQNTDNFQKMWGSVTPPPTPPHTHTPLSTPLIQIRLGLQWSKDIKIYKFISRHSTQHDWFVPYTKFQEVGRTFNFQNRFVSKGEKVLQVTNLPHTIEFRMIDLFPIPNFKKIEECLFCRTNLGLKEQWY